MVSKGSRSTEPIDLSNIREADIAAHYFHIDAIPYLMRSPLREDINPSFVLYSPNGTEINYKDFGTKEGGTIWTLLTKLWNCSYNEVRERVYKTLGSSSPRLYLDSINTAKTKIECKIRDWKPYDIEYWKSYGISLEWLKFARVYPISHKIITKYGKRMVFGADKYAYCFVEYKDNKTTLKLYQPYNTNGFKWCTNHDKSIISLWSKLPKEGNSVCICASLKDALCLWGNTGIPSVSLQGEGYNISITALQELHNRFNTVYICFDNDEAGIKDAKNLVNITGFTNIVLPKFSQGKDISDLYKSLSDKSQFKQIMINLFNYDTQRSIC